MADLHRVIPLVGFDGIRFGDTRSKVRKYLKNTFNLDYSTFEQGNGDILAENYRTFNVYFDEKDCCEAVEFSDDCVVVIGDVAVLPGTVKHMLDLFPDIGNDLLSYKNSIGIYAPEGEEIEALLFGAPDYYNGYKV